jgi:hypothetical protein
MLPEVPPGLRLLVKLPRRDDVYARLLWMLDCIIPYEAGQIDRNVIYYTALVFLGLSAERLPTVLNLFLSSTDFFLSSTEVVKNVAVGLESFVTRNHYPLKFIFSQSLYPRRKEQMHTNLKASNKHLELVSSYGLRQIGIFQEFDIILREPDPDILTRLINSLPRVQPQDGTTPFAQTPRGGHSSHAYALAPGNLLHSPHNRPINITLPVADHALQKAVCLLSLRFPRCPRAGEDSTAEGRPWDETNSCILAVGDHLALFLAVE